MAQKTALVTGASRGIGRGIALELARAGCRVAINYAGNAEAAAEALALVKAAGGDGFIVQGDVAVAADRERLVAETIKQFGRIDLLVNNAGATQRGDFLTLSEADWQDGFALKFFAAVRCTRAAWAHLQASQGAVINIVGIGGRTGSEEFAIGGAVNAGLLNLTKVLAERGIRDGVRVNAINPGSIATDRLQVRIARFAAEHQLSPDAAAAAMAQKMGIARFGQSEEVARMVAFLASPAAAYCQGAIIDVDGGQTRTL